MTRVRARTEKIRRFILERVEESPRDVSNATSAKFGITRQAVNKHLRRLLAEGVLRRSGNTRAQHVSAGSVIALDLHLPDGAGPGRGCRLDA